MSRRFTVPQLISLLLLLSFGPQLSLSAPRGAKPGPSPPNCTCSNVQETCCRSFKGLTVLTGELKPCAPAWRKLDLSLNSISTLAAFNTASCSNLRQLILFMNKLNVTLDSTTLRHLKGLERLNLSRNSLERLRGSPFRNLTRLQALDLSHNRLRVLSKATFRDLESLEVLRLFGNFIGFLEARTFASLVRLRKLDLTQNNITRLRTASFRGLTSLEELTLQQNPIKELESDVFSEMTNLQTLQLGICGKIGEVPRLEGNIFTRLTRLKTFNFSTCRITDLHLDAFRGLGAVRTLSLRGNRLARINRTVWEPLLELTVLDLAHNRLECLYQSNFLKLGRLIELDLSFNLISFLADSAFGGLNQLQRLRLDGNPLRVVEPGAFCQAPRLFSVSLLGVDMHDKFGLGPRGSNGSLSASLNYLSKEVTIVLPSPRQAKGLGKPCRPFLPSTPAELNSVVCPIYLGPDPITGKAHSRQYLLISVAVCVAFLFMALGVIMSYRAWSKRKRNACEKAEQAALEEEKQEMMAKPAPVSGAANGAGGSATKELLAAGQSAENGVVLHERYVPMPSRSSTGEPGDKPEKAETSKEEEEEATMTHLAVV